jgi:hypothetical protein
MYSPLRTFHSAKNCVGVDLSQVMGSFLLWNLFIIVLTAFGGYTRMEYSSSRRADLLVRYCLARLHQYRLHHCPKHHQRSRRHLHNVFIPDQYRVHDLKTYVKRVPTRSAIVSGTIWPRNQYGVACFPDTALVFLLLGPHDSRLQ